MIDYQMSAGTRVRVKRANGEAVEGVILNPMPWILTGEWYLVGRPGQRFVETVRKSGRKKVRCMEQVADELGMYSPDMMEVLA